MDETLRLYWLDDENIFGFEVDESLISVHPIMSAEHLLEFAPSWASEPRALDGDVIICDFKLVPDPDRATKKVLDVGLDMDAAGFLAGLLLAIGNRQSPLAVIPYSGEHAQFDRLWKLTKAFCPRWIIVGDGFHVHDKSESDLMKIIDASVKSYRDLIKGLFQAGTLEIDQLDRRKMLSLRNNVLRMNESLCVHETISFVSGGIRRSLKFGSLFYDEVKGRVQADGKFKGARGELDPIVEYFSFLPEESASEVAARELSARFIDAALSDRSCDIYEGAIAGEAMAVPEKPTGWIANHAPDPEVKRLVLLRVFVAAYCAARSIPDAIVRLCDKINGIESDITTTFRTDDVPELLINYGITDRKDLFFHKLLDRFIHRWNLETSPDLASLEQYCRLLFSSPEDLKNSLSWKFIQFLEPLPEDIISNLNTHLRYGIGLQRYLDDAREDIKFSPMKLLASQNPIPIKLPIKDASYVKQCVLEFIPAELLRPEFIS